MSARREASDRVGRLSFPERYGRAWALVLGGGLAVALAKFGNPVILDQFVESPRGWAEWLVLPWPLAYGYALLVAVAVAALPLLARSSVHPRWAWLLPLAWLAWQGVATAGSLDRGKSGPVLLHYVSVVACFGFGFLILGRQRERDARWFWWMLTAGFVWVLLAGFEQHYGGLEATRERVYAQPDWATLPPDFLKRLERDRVFATLFYANTFAGVILLLLPALGWSCWRSWPERFRRARAVSTGLLAYSGLACLYWTGSKAGWLIAIAVAAVAALHAPMNRRLRVALVAVGLVIGLAAFGWRFQEYFRRGATSAVARFDYWAVAAQIVVERPLRGSGPGTFEPLYRDRKPPEAEMSRLVHNDYLQQASDSGIPGALLFAGWVIGILAYGYRSARVGGLSAMVWLGLLGWALQGLVEFGLFIPAVAWVALTLLGWLAARAYSDRQSEAC